MLRPSLVILERKGYTPQRGGAAGRTYGFPRKPVFLIVFYMCYRKNQKNVSRSGSAGQRGCARRGFVSSLPLSYGA